MKHQLETEIGIAASPEAVWEILADLDRYEEWNPFITSSQGTVAVGETLKNRMQNPGGRAMTIKPTVTVADPGRTFEWCGQLGIRGLFDARHRFELEPTNEGTQLRHSEHFSGMLVRFMRKMVDTDTREGFEQMNASLKTRAESHSGSPS